MTTQNDLNYGFFIGFDLHIDKAELIMEYLFVSFRIVNSEEDSSSWKETMVYPALRANQNKTYHVDGQLPNALKDRDSLLVVTAMDRKEDVVFSFPLAYRWVCAQRQKLNAGMPAEKIYYKSDLIHVSLWVRCMGRKVGESMCLSRNTITSISALDTCYHELEKECLSFRGWFTSLIQRKNFPYTLTGRQCSLPVYCLSVLKDVIDSKSFGFSGRVKNANTMMFVRPWETDMYKAWTVTRLACKNDEQTQLWWYMIDLLTGNTSSHRKCNMSRENELPMPAFCTNTYTNPTDRLARRVALAQFIMNRTSFNHEVFFFLQSRNFIELLADKLVAIAICIPEGQEECVALHGLCKKDALDTCATREVFTGINDDHFYLDDWRSANISTEMELLLLFWSDFHDVFCLAPSIFTQLTCISNKRYTISINSDIPAHLYKAKADSASKYVSYATQTETSMMLRPHITDDFFSMGNNPEELQQVEWQTGWIHQPSSLRVGRQSNLNFVKPSGFSFH